MIMKKNNLIKHLFYLIKSLVNLFFMNFRKCNSKIKQYCDNYGR